MRWRILGRFGVAVALVVAATGIGRLGGADLTVAAMVLLLAVLGAALLGPWPGVLAAVAGYFLYDYYFTPPAHHFDFQRGTNIVAGIAFFVTALVIGWVVTALGALRARDRRRARETELRLDLLDRIAAGEGLDSLAQHAATLIGALFDGRACTLSLGAARGATDDADGTAWWQASAGNVTAAVSESAGRLRGDDRELLRALVATLAGTLEQARLRHETRQAQLAFELSESQAGLVSAVSHNLRTPLASIRTAAATLRSPDANLSAADRQELLDIVGDESQRLERMVAKTLDLSRIRAGGLRPERQTVDIADVASAAMRRLRPLIRGQTLRLDVAADLEPVTVDVSMIEDVLLNLLENALRFSPPGDVITLEAGERDGAVELRVSDHGPGVPPSERDRIFDAFVRGEHPDDALGTGLGLAIVRGHLAAHAGDVWVEDTPGGGATFVIRFPREGPS